MRRSLFAAPVVALLLVACGDGGPAGDPPVGSTQSPGLTPIAADGITLTSSTPERVTGVYADGRGDVLTFDFAKVNDDLYFDLTGDGGRPIMHIETNADAYDFSYMGGRLTMHTTKEFVAAQRAQAQQTPDNVSTDGFVFTGDTHALDDMLALPEMRQLPDFSRALGARGITGNDYPASLALHKVAQQTAQSLQVDVPKLDVASGVAEYCTAYPNRNNDCYGMCGPGCSCWSWVCGDCCYHYGCAVHDSWCREGKWYYCYNITAVIALFGC
jgi:hypothetical protein